VLEQSAQLLLCLPRRQVGRVGLRPVAGVPDGRPPCRALAGVLRPGRSEDARVLAVGVPERPPARFRPSPMTWRWPLATTSCFGFTESGYEPCSPKCSHREHLGCSGRPPTQQNGPESTKTHSGPMLWEQGVAGSKSGRPDWRATGLQIGGLCRAGRWETGKMLPRRVTEVPVGSAGWRPTADESASCVPRGAGAGRLGRHREAR
jgi:hypothetical protein